MIIASTVVAVSLVDFFGPGESNLVVDTPMEGSCDWGVLGVRLVSGLS